MNSQLDSYTVSSINYNETEIRESAITAKEPSLETLNCHNKGSTIVNKSSSKKTYERYRTEAKQIQEQKNKHPMIEIHNHHCRLNCAVKISEDCRKQIYNEYWSLGKTRRMWLNKFVEIMNVKSKLINRTRKRESTIQYYLPAPNSDREAVCQKFFLATLGYHHNSIVMTFIKAKTDTTGKHLIEPKMDMRGKREPGNKKDMSLIIDHVNTYKPVNGANTSDKVYLPATLNVKEMYKNFCDYYPNLLCYEVYRKQVRRMNIQFGNPIEKLKTPESNNEVPCNNQLPKCVPETNRQAKVKTVECSEIMLFQQTGKSSSVDSQNNSFVQSNNTPNESTLITQNGKQVRIPTPDSDYLPHFETVINVVNTDNLPTDKLKVKCLKKPRRRCRYIDAELKLKHPLIPMIDHQCRYKCNEQFDQHSRQRIHDEYWNLGLEKRIWLNKYIQICEVKTHLISSKKIRTNSFLYDLPNENGSTKRVCQKFFLGTLGYTHSSIVSTFVKSKKDQFGRPLNIPKMDMRGKHSPKNKKNRMVILDHIHTFLPLIGKTSKLFYLSPKLSIMDMFKDFCLYHSGKMSYEVYRAVVKKLNLIFDDPTEETEIALIDDFTKVIYPTKPINLIESIIPDTTSNINNNTALLINEPDETEAKKNIKETNNSLEKRDSNNQVEFLHVPDEHKIINSSGLNLVRKNRIAAMKKKHKMYTVKEKCCRLNCNINFTDDLRKSIHEKFWSFDNNERRLWINNYVKVVPVKRQHRNAKTNRQNSAIYSLPCIDGVCCKVCQRFFLSTLGYANSSVISSFIRAKISSSGERLELPRIDMRGRRTPNNKIDRTCIVNHIESIRAQNLSVKEMFKDFILKNHVKISYELYRLEVKRIQNSLIEPVIHLTTSNNEYNILEEEYQINSNLANDKLENAKKNSLEITNNSNQAYLNDPQILESSTIHLKINKNVLVTNKHQILPIIGKKCCPNKCNFLFNDEMRSNINYDFWSLTEADQLLWLGCFINPLKKSKEKPSKKCSVEYHLPHLGGRSECVCRKFFLATLGYVLRNSINKIIRSKLLSKSKSTNTMNEESSIKNTNQCVADDSNKTKSMLTCLNKSKQRNKIISNIDKILFEPVIRIQHELVKPNESEPCQKSFILASAENQPKFENASMKNNNFGGFEFFDYSSNKQNLRNTKRAEFVTEVNHLCRQKCKLFNIETRKAIYDMFWKLDIAGQENWLHQHIRKTEIKRRLCNRKRKRSYSLLYELPLNDTKNERVCQKLFLATLGYTTSTLITKFIRVHFDTSAKKFDVPKELGGKCESLQKI